MKQQVEWIPIKVRELTYEERENYCDDNCLMTWDCPLPDNGEEVLVTLTNNIIDMTTFYDDYFEDYEWEDLSAWARLPKPYAVSQQKRGEWIKRSSVVNWECSLCGSDIIATEQRIATYNYCPNCGEKMRLK